MIGDAVIALRSRDAHLTRSDRLIDSRASISRAQVELPQHRRVRSAANGRRDPPGVIAVVKANAYGHGAGQVARALEDAGADLLACADIEEGAALRAAGVRAEILVFGALSVSDLDGLFDCRLTPTISTPGAAQAVQAAAARYKQQLRYHLKIDTGMNRLGFRFDNLRRTLPELLASENLELDAVYTHFATADDPGVAAVRAAARAVRAARIDASVDAALGGRRRAVPARRQQRGAAARFARLVRPRAARACCSTASCRRRSRRRSRSRRS